MNRDQKAAVALRAAAYDFTAPHPVLDAEDRAGQRRNGRLLRAAIRYGMTKKRPYSREHTPKTERRLVLMADRVPATLHEAVMAKAKRDGVSVRTLILRLVTRWLDEAP